MKLVTEEICLTTLEEEDIQLISSYTNDYKLITPFYSTKIRSKVHWMKRFKETGLWDDNYGMFKIIDLDDNSLSGVIWFFKPPSQHSQLEFYEVAFNIFRPEKRKKGLATQALKLATSYLFHTYSIARIQSTTMLDINDESISKVTKSTGFKYEGTMRNAIFIRGKYVNIQLFSILREESTPLDELIIKE